MPVDTEIVEGLVSELRRGTLVLAALSQLRQPQYGYALVQTLAEKGMPAEANTLYPLLRRLEGQGLLSSDWETDSAKPRKYYTLTERGRGIYAALKTEWSAAAASIASLIEEDI